MMQNQPAAAAPDRQGFAERLVSAGQRPSTNVEIRSVPDGPVEPLPPGYLPWTPLSDEIRDWRKEQEIGYPFPPDPGFETQTGPMPDVSQGLYHPAGTIDMGPYPPDPDRPFLPLRTMSAPRRPR
jgi:hypothetical protein